MEYVQSAKEVGKGNIFFGIISFVVFWFLSFLFTGSELPTWAKYVPIVIGFLTSCHFINQGRVLLKCDGNWVIKIDQTGITWNSPCEVIDKSFYLSFKDVDCVGTRLTLTAKNPSHYERVLVKKDGTLISLSGECGIDTNKFYDDIISFGIPFKITHITSRSS